MSHLKVASTIIILALVAMLGFKWLQPLIMDELQTQTSDAKNVRATLNIGVDGWAGYFPLCSPEMLRRSRSVGLIVNCIDDKANYSERYKKLKSGDYDFAVGTIDSYLLNAKQVDFPGTIVAVIDESKGGDAIVARASRYDNLDALKTLKEGKIAFTPASPSHHLLKSVASHFDIPQLLSSSHWQETNGSEAALKALLNGKVDIAVVWEPEVSLALANQDITLLLSTKDTQKLIVDVLIASRSLVQHNPAIIEEFLGLYFKSLSHYRQNRDELIRDLATYSGLKKKQAAIAIEGVAWTSLKQNASDWFKLNGSQDRPALSSDYLVESINATIDILVNSGDFSRSPLPNGNPYRIINSEFIQSLTLKYVGGQFENSPENTENSFVALSDGQWKKLETVGTLKVRPIIFSSGTSDLNDAAKAQIDQIAKSIAHYPSFRIEVRGHTGTRGDKRQNQILSQNRAQAVLDYLKTRHGISATRGRALGYGGTQALPKKAGESQRAYQYRLPRVEIFLVAEPL